MCSEFVKQRKTRESKTWINNCPQGAGQVKVISRACACTPCKLATGCREKYFQTVNMLCFIIICLFGCQDSSQCCSISN